MKRSPELPLRFSKEDWSRMGADAERFGWSWVIAWANPYGRVSLLDPGKAYKRKEVRLKENARIDNPLAWLDVR